MQAAAGVSTEIFYAYDNANSELESNNTLTAAGEAYNQTLDWLNEGTLGSLTNTNGIYTLPITINGQQDEIVWDANGRKSMSVNFGQYQDLYGNTHSISHGSVTIRQTPILLEGPIASGSGNGHG
jgi:hypothetical protein